MACTIAVQDVRDNCDTSLSDLMINGFIAQADKSDACLDLNNVPCDLVKTLKVLYCCHMIALSEGGQIKSESDMAGASISIDRPDLGKGLDATTFGMSLQQLDEFGCVTSLAKPQRFIFTSGGKCPAGTC